MQDVIAKAESWFEQQRQRHLSVFVEYRPIGSLLPRTCKATLVTGKWEAVNSAGQLVRLETKDFFINRSDLPSDPKKGDKISVTTDGVEQLYEVSIPDGETNVWRWADRSESIRRVHTMTISRSNVAATPYLARYVGSHPSTQITDQQIKASLSGDLASTRAMERQITATNSYVYVVLAESLGTPMFRINSLANSAWEMTARSMEFDGQTARPYRIYRSTYPITGTLLLEVL